MKALVDEQVSLLDVLEKDIEYRMKRVIKKVQQYVSELSSSFRITLRHVTLFHLNG